MKKYSFPRVFPQKLQFAALLCFDSGYISFAKPNFSKRLKDTLILKHIYQIHIIILDNSAIFAL
jgi:hypothetical protein